MRVVLDSGILVRVSLNPTGPATRLIKLLVASRHPVLVSEFILSEVARVLGYPRMTVRHGLGQSGIEAHVRWLRSIGELVQPVVGPPIVLDDPKDDPVVYTAISGNADALCTLDRHFYTAKVLEGLGRDGVQVMSDVALLRKLLS